MNNSVTPQKDDRAEENKPSQRKRIMAIAFFAIAVIAIAQILSNLGLIPGVWANVASSIVSILSLILTILSLRQDQSIHIHIPDHSVQHDSAHPIIAEHPASDATQQTSRTVAPPRKYRKIVGALPAISPLSIQQREETVKQVYAALTQPHLSAVVLTGIGGSGKSTLAALVYSSVEKRQQQEEKFFTGNSIWLTVDAGITMADMVGTIFEALGLPIPDLEHLTPSNQALVLFDALKNTDQSHLLVLDQFENFLNWQTGHALEGRLGVDEWLDVLNSRELDTPGCRILLTSRILPRGAHEYPFTYLQEHPLEGLQQAEGVELLKMLTHDARTSDKDLQLAVERCNGHAYALTLLASLLRDHHLSLSELFKDPLYIELWEGDLASKMLDYIYQQQLTQVQRDLLLAFSVYRRAVPLNAAQAAIDPAHTVSLRELTKALKALLNLHLLQVAGEGRYQLHAIAIGYAHKQFDDDDEQQNRHDLHAAYARAALYYQHTMATSYPPPGQRQSVEDIQPLIEMLWELCKAEQWQRAYDLMLEEKLIEDFNRLGNTLIPLEIFQNLLPLTRWQPSSKVKANIYKHLGQIHYRLGELEQALDYSRQALQICQEDENSNEQGEVLFFLGEIYHSTGPIEKSLSSYEEALACYQQQHNRKGIALTFTNLCWVYAFMGQFEKALDLGQQALSLYQEMHDRWGESRCYDALAQVYNDMEQKDQAQHYLELALQLYRELGNHWQEGWMYVHLGKLRRTVHNLPQAQHLFQQALEISHQVKNPWVESAALMELGNIFFVLDQPVQAHEHYQKALSVSHSVKNRWGECRVLNALGQLRSHEGKQAEAIQYFWQAMAICREIGNHTEESISLCGVAEIYIQKEQYRNALAALCLAKSMYQASQTSYPSQLQTLLDRLRAILHDEQYTKLSAQIEPEAAHIVERLIKEA